jgi:hypothetical protein
MSEAVLDVLQAGLMVLIKTIAPVVAALVVVWLRKQIQKAKLQMESEAFLFTQQLVKNLVQAAQQYDLATKVKRAGEEKKLWVLEQAEKVLESKGLKFDLELIASLVESAYYEGFTQPEKFLNLGGENEAVEALE